MAQVRHGITGNAILTAGGYSFYWNGPGSAIRLQWGDQLVSIDALAGWHAADLAEARSQVEEALVSFGTPRAAARAQAGTLPAKVFA